MSDTSRQEVNRPLLIVLGVVIGIGALFAGWVFIVQPLLAPAEPVQDVQGTESTPTPVPGSTPDPLTPTASPEDLLALGEVDEELFELAGARDPFRQVVVSAQSTADSGGASSDGTVSDGTVSDGTGSDGTVSDGTGSDGTDGATSDGSTADGTASDGTDGSTTAGGSGTGGSGSGGSGSGGSTDGSTTGGSGSGGSGTGGSGSGGSGSGGSGTGGSGTDAASTTDSTADGSSDAADTDADAPVDPDGQYGTGGTGSSSSPDGIDQLAATGLPTSLLAGLALLFGFTGAVLVRGVDRRPSA